MHTKSFFNYLFTTFILAALGLGVFNEMYPVTISNSKKINKEATSGLKYILLWSMAEDMPFVFMGKGPHGFITRQCPYTNCYVTSDRDLLDNYTEFDVIAFDVKEVTKQGIRVKPKSRSPHQKYVFASTESADNYPMCYPKFPLDFFNWTWTYKLNSDSMWGYISIRDKENKVIGPKEDMNWMKLEDMAPVSDDLKSQLRKKTKLAAWFTSNCKKARRSRDVYVHALQEELKKLNLSVDVYGKCGTLVCERSKQEECEKMIKNDYYFYLAFENSLSEDYVTEKLLRALNNNAVPVVYGGANYTRFLADGTYLNARRLTPKALALKMKLLKENPDEYFSYFRWRNHYTYNDRNAHVDSNDYCAFCELLNNEEKVKTQSSYHDIAKWWNPDGRCGDQSGQNNSENFQKNQLPSSDPYKPIWVIGILLFAFLATIIKLLHN